METQIEAANLGEENVEAALTALFREISAAETLDPTEFDCAHRAKTLDPTEFDHAHCVPHEIICCLHSYKVKEKIMAKAQDQRSDSEVWRWHCTEICPPLHLKPAEH
ncbi:Hypothetical predicted protein [Pelobates cultripes]|uniref:Uncharacterized protein n=1 Tax=Pelobates cultripes TaxID=61616 RepID=A0AAD1TDB8_PELCU|nr:Hypothetical predicted protein [Pelobates cultripes]